jgi:hypothetical protein
MAPHYFSDTFTRIFAKKEWQSMSVLPRVTELTRERISREFDDLGPDACMAEIKMDLRQHNPELLDMASRWAGVGGEATNLMTAFGMFYRLLAAEARAPLGSAALNPLPRVSAEVRDTIVKRIDRTGDETFTREAIDNLEVVNPELLQMAHGYASRRPDYGRTMQGFALLHEALLMQSRRDRASRHSASCCFGSGSPSNLTTVKAAGM